jgi:hypothetical protein
VLQDDFASKNWAMSIRQFLVVQTGSPIDAYVSSDSRLEYVGSVVVPLQHTGYHAFEILPVRIA